MDKVICRVLLDGCLPLHDRILCVSGRISFELVQKAAVAGAPILGGPRAWAVTNQRLRLRASRPRAGPAWCSPLASHGSSREERQHGGGSDRSCGSDRRLCRCLRSDRGRVSRERLSPGGRDADHRRVPSRGRWTSARAWWNLCLRTRRSGWPWVGLPLPSRSGTPRHGLGRVVCTRTRVGAALDSELGQGEFRSNSGHGPVVYCARRQHRDRRTDHRICVPAHRPSLRCRSRCARLPSRRRHELAAQAPVAPVAGRQPRDSQLTWAHVTRRVEWPRLTSSRPPVERRRRIRRPVPDTGEDPVGPGAFAIARRSGTRGEGSVTVVRLVGSRDLEASLMTSMIRGDRGLAFVLVGLSQPRPDLPVGSCSGPKDLYVSTRILSTGRSTRCRRDGCDNPRPGPDADLLRRQVFISQVGARSAQRPAMARNDDEVQQRAAARSCGPAGELSEAS